MKKIYIVLVKAQTGLGKTARFLTHYPYTHIAVSFDKSMTNFYGFSRKYHNLPFCAGFMCEKRDYFAFGKHKFFDAKIFELPVSEDNYKKILKFIFRCKTGTFNIMATKIRIKNTYNCMTFTAKILKLTGLFDMSRPYDKYNIPDMDKIMEKHCVFEGKIKRKTSESYKEYMKIFSLSEYIRSFTEMIYKLVKLYKGGKI